MTKIFLSTKGTLDDVALEIRNFLSFVDGLPVEDAFVDEIRDLIDKLKRTEKEKVNYMTFQMKIDEEREEARAEGIAEGQEHERISSIRNLMETLHFTAQQAMDALKIPASEQSRYAALL